MLKVRRAYRLMHDALARRMHWVLACNSTSSRAPPSSASRS
jgi:hypothetical protein